LFAAASIWAVRNVFLVGMLGPALLAAYVPSRRGAPRLAGVAAMALLAAGIAGGAAFGRTFQLRAATWRYPEGAADFRLRHKIRGRIFISYAHGGYLMWRLWPEQQVFIDGRALHESLYNDYRRIASNADDSGGKSGEELL